MISKNAQRRAALYNSVAAIAILAGASTMTPPTFAAEPAKETVAEATYSFDIPAQDLGSALRAFASASKQQVVFDGAVVRGKTNAALSGTFTADQGIRTLLDGTGLSVHRGERGVLLVDSQTLGGTQADRPLEAAADKAWPETEGTPEILVRGRRTINADIKRTRDDAQPYVTFDAEQIQRSQASSLDDFFKTRLPMNAVQSSQNQVSSGTTGGSSINLRGLGSNQTLILVDGRRLANINRGGLFSQPDINGLPLAAIERIEVLPSTASGIYGGGATGGVINIITKKDYVGTDVQATYGSSTRGDAQEYRVDGSTGFALEGGRTHVLINGSYKHSDPLIEHDRDFLARAMALRFANNPASFLSATTPPAGYTSNIRSTDGSNLVLKSGAALGSAITFVPVGYAGTSTDGGTALIANAGKYNLAPADTALLGGLGSLLGGSEVASSSMNVRREFSDWFEAFADVSWSTDNSLSYFTSSPSSVTLAATAPNNPFTTAINVGFPATNLAPPVKVKNDTLRVATGAIVHLPHHWTAAVDYVWSKTTNSYSYTPSPVGDPDGTGPAISSATALANGTLNVLRDLNRFPLDWSPYLFPSPATIGGPTDSNLNDVTLRLSGPTFDLPGGPLILSGSAEYRHERAEELFNDNFNTATAVFTTGYATPRSQAVTSIYLEARAPIISEKNDIPLMRVLEVQASARRDDYTTKSTTPATLTLASRSSPIPAVTSVSNGVDATKYTVGLRYVPVDDITLRASRGTGFLPPSIDQLSAAALTPSSAAVVDSKRGAVLATIPFARTGGGNPDLKPESSESWSAGVVFTPHFIPDLRLSVDYTFIKKTNEITSLAVNQLFELESLFPSRITRLPLTPQDQALGYTGGVVSSVDLTLLNAQGTRLKAYDFQGDYTWHAGTLGDFNFNLAATYQPLLSRQLAPNAAFSNTAGFAGGVLRWRGNAGIVWKNRQWTAGWNAQYYDSYFAYTSTAAPASITTTVLNQGSAKIPSQTYHDIFAAYKFGESAMFAQGALDGAEVILGIQNLFDKSPPIISSSGLGGSSASSTYGDPRLQRFTLTLRKHF